MSDTGHRPFRVQQQPLRVREAQVSPERSRRRARACREGPVELARGGVHAAGQLFDIAEVFRTGIEAIHKGQREAAVSVGLAPAQVYRYIILPQAVRIVLPPLLNMLIILLKDTSICSLISTPEIMLRAKDVAMISFLPMHAFVLAAGICFLLAWPMSMLTRRLEHRMRRGMRSAGP